MQWGKEHRDVKRHYTFAAGSILVSAFIFVGLVWPYNSSLASRFTTLASNPGCDFLRRTDRQ